MDIGVALNSIFWNCGKIVYLACEENNFLSLRVLHILYLYNYTEDNSSVSRSEHNERKNIDSTVWGVLNIKKEVWYEITVL